MRQGLWSWWWNVLRADHSLNLLTSEGFFAEDELFAGRFESQIAACAIFRRVIQAVTASQSRRPASCDSVMCSGLVRLGRSGRAQGEEATHKRPSGAERRIRVSRRKLGPVWRR